MSRTYRRVVHKEPHHKNAIPYVRRGNKVSFDINNITIEIEEAPRNRHGY